ncbi:hypothetical protein FN846DRAFT_911164 [Sphaerosporella brunnea]|uniref:Uncharacterized protein n=1 Tax=Sphaerosporella brunnea TaxID=1250544 RepID=A0A5J5ELL0_9PEZI|nr:hypothetical protein FN846DRAFT_911164 [Sphaerosporella brunnea]
MSVDIMAAFIRSLIQGPGPAAAAADAANAAVATTVADALDAAVSTPATDGETSVATVPWLSASGRSDDVKKHKRKPKRKCKAKQMPIENDNPRKVPKLKSDTSASDNGLAATPGLSSAPAVQRNTRSINVDVPNYQGVDIAWNLDANGTVSAVTFSFGGSTS